MGIKKGWRNFRWKLSKKLIREDEYKLLESIFQTKEYQPAVDTDILEKGDKVYVCAAVDDIVDDFVICKNNYGYYFTVPKADIIVKK